MVTNIIYMLAIIPENNYLFKITDNTINYGTLFKNNILCANINKCLFSAFRMCTII